MFYDGRPENLKLWEARFTLVSKRGFLSSVGSSKELGEFLSEYKPVEDTTTPFEDTDRIKEAQKRLRQEAERRKKEKEANQPK
jgi:hypothetical protein